MGYTLTLAVAVACGAPRRGGGAGAVGLAPRVRRSPLPAARAQLYCEPNFWTAVDASLSGHTVSGRVAALLSAARTGADAEGDASVDAAVDGELPPGAARQDVESDMYLPGLAATAVWGPPFAAWLLRLEATTAVLQAELENALKDLEDLGDDGGVLWTSNTHRNSAWASLQLARPWSQKWSPVGEQLFPLTTAALSKLGLPSGARYVSVNRQGPRSGVALHTDKCNFVLRAHLGLRVPDKCGMILDGNLAPWRNGEASVFDASFFHETFNDSDEARFILNVDLWHPDLEPDERIALETFLSLRDAHLRDALDPDGR
ncbi:Aspartyl/Asparaginyl beta-hydroxylase-domain-containing protein [Pelagophyceae sp. CCMP2097]|nr:Aspartyl/Asparaginyl beta-hydroxylase-domain-containing protein [Pelagophyceae sp. CCMP2097]